MEKCFNDAMVGNKKILSCFTNKGELIRLYYPDIDFKQHIDLFHIGVKINDSQIIYLHNDINNIYEQQYIEDTNILKTNITNKYFDLKIEQVDAVTLKDDIIIKKYNLKNENNIELNINFIVRSRLLSHINNPVSARIYNNSLLQYNSDSIIAIFSNQNLLSYQLHDVENDIQSGIIGGKDYIGMSNDSAISYQIGELKPGEERSFTLFLCAESNKNIKSQTGIENKIDKIKRADVQKEITKIDKYWKKYIVDHINIDINKFNQKAIEIYKRSILLFPLLANYDTGGLLAATEFDEQRKYCGGYAYCWPRDAVFITKALDLLKMQNISNDFYLKFCLNTQSSNGMWEQRFYTNGKLAPCWGYQIDETASVIYGVYEHYKITKDLNFLKQAIKMCEKACNFLFKYIENLLQIEETDTVAKEMKEKIENKNEVEKHVSYDLWEMNEGVHLYSLSSIYAAFGAMLNIENELQTKSQKSNNSRLKQEIILKRKVKLGKYQNKIKNYILENFYDKKQKIFYRNLEDKKMDISILGLVYPFDVLNIYEKSVKNTIEKINMTLRTYTGGILRFEDDHYIGGKNPWVISCLWMALYYVKAKKMDEAVNLLNFVVNTASDNNFLAEQIDNESLKPAWVLGLGWSHAMFVLVLNSLDKEN